MGRWCRIIEAWIWMRSRCSLSFWHFWKEVENFETWYRERRVSISSKTLHFLFLKLNPWNSWQRCSDFANLEDNWCNRGTILNAFCVAQKVLRHKNYKISSYCRFWFFYFTIFYWMQLLELQFNSIWKQKFVDLPVRLEIMIIECDRCNGLEPQLSAENYMLSIWNESKWHV